MLVDDGSSDDSTVKWEVSGDLSTIAIPPTIHALLATRLDRLAEEERAVIERAAVVRPGVLMGCRRRAVPARDPIRAERPTSGPCWTRS